MMLYLVRHGKAEQGADDDRRRLTDGGRKTVRRVARHLKEAGIRVERIEQSGLVRATETAEILQAALGGDVIEVDGLRPEDDVTAIAGRLHEGGVEDLMLVGHLPCMGELASYLLTGSAEDFFHFRTSAVACLSDEEGGWMLEWFLDPNLV